MQAAPLPESAETAAQHTISIARGSVYLSRELCDQYLPGVSTIALLFKDGRVFLLPLHGATAGGVLLKIRNARGDRVAHAVEFLGSIGIEPDAPERCVGVRWMSDIAGLLLEGVSQSADQFGQD